MNALFLKSVVVGHCVTVTGWKFLLPELTNFYNFIVHMDSANILVNTNRKNWLELECILGTVMFVVDGKNLFYGRSLKWKQLVCSLKLLNVAICCDCILFALLLDV